MSKALTATPMHPADILGVTSQSSPEERTAAPGFPYDFYERELVKNMVYGGMRESILAA
jgi:hypothetical protein